ncbi:MAG: flagellar basal body P-ring formation chaperone FlgA [Pseudomonadota bacterium]
MFVRGIAFGLVAGLLMMGASKAKGEDRSGGLLPVPAELIERGTTITADMLTERHFYFDPERPLSVLTSPTPALGKAARVTLRAGKPIPKNAFRRVQLISRGRPAEAVFRLGGLTITAAVLPQDDGAAGDLVRARNMDSHRVIAGIVSATGKIEVSAP